MTSRNKRSGHTAHVIRLFLNENCHKIWYCKDRLCGNTGGPLIRQRSVKVNIAVFGSKNDVVNKRQSDAFVESSDVMFQKTRHDH